MMEHGTYDLAAREQLIIDVSSTLMPYMIDAFGLPNNVPAARALLPAMTHLYVNYHREMLEGQRRLVAELVKHPPGLFRGLPPFTGEMFYDIRNEDISVASASPDKLALHALVNTLTLRARSRTRIWPFRSFATSVDVGDKPYDCEGSREQLRSYCLLRLRPSPTNHLQLQAVRKVLQAIDVAEPEGGYQDWLRALLAQTGHKDETDWLLSCLLSGNPNLAYEALGAVGDCHEARLLKTARQILLERSVRSDVRARAMWAVTRRPDRATLLALTQVLDDPSPLDNRAYHPELQEGYPLANSMSLRTLRPVLELLWSQPAETIGQRSLENLKALTKKDFGTDAQEWKKWIQRHVR